MNIILLSPCMENYGAAFYQNDFINKLKNKHNVYQYGPGLDKYSKRDDIKKVKNKSPFSKIDCICTGHGWLRDDPNESVNRHTKIDLQKLNDVIKVFILNKEYTNLAEKLEYAKENEFDIGLSHHHDVKTYENKSGVKFFHWPFAVNKERFYDYGLEKEFDVTFSGLLKNPTFPNKHSNVRRKIQKEIFYCIGDVRLMKKQKYERLSIFWRSKLPSRIQNKISKIVHSDYRLSDHEYKRLLNRSKICLNTLSPMNIIGTRYYETMASNSLVLAENSYVYDSLFKRGKHYVPFDKDLKDFYKKIIYYLENENERRRIAGNGHRLVMRKHTWDKRIEEFTNLAKAHIGI